MLPGTHKRIGKCLGLLMSVGLAWSVMLMLSENRSQARSSEASHTQFLHALDRQIQIVNKEWLEKRAHLLRLDAAFRHHRAIGVFQMRWIWMNVARHAITFNPYSAREWRDLERRIDVVPIDVVLNEAAKDSHNGTSLLARQGRNFFNMIIAKPEFGIADIPVSVSQKRLNWLEPDDVQYAKYYSNQVALSDFIWMLNSADQFRHFRDIRAALRKHHVPIATAFSESLQQSVQGRRFATDSLYSRHFNPVELPTLFSNH